jgi:hypothetical protein
MLTDEQLKDLAGKMHIPLDGVYFKDELPRNLKYNVSYIINLEDSIDKDGNENEGTHWTCLQVAKYPNGTIEPIFFDPYGAPPSEAVIKFVKDSCGKYLPYNKRDLQSLMNNACGYFCLAFLHFVNAYPQRTKDLYQDCEQFLDLFDDLNTSIEWKKNEFVLKHFFQSSDPKLRKAIDVIANTNEISSADENPNMFKIPIATRMI